MLETNTQRVVENTTNVVKQQFSKTSTAAAGPQNTSDISIQNALKKSVLKAHNNPSPVP